MANLAGDRDEAIRSLGHELLVAGAGFGTRSAEEIVQTDLKYYTTHGQTLAIAQVEVPDFEAVDARLTELHAGLGQLRSAKELVLALLLVTDILRGDSRIIAVGDAVLIGKLPFVRHPDGTLAAPGVVSRKKQLVPLVLAAAQ